MKIQIASGRLVDPTNLMPEDIDFSDIASSLSKLCRFGGHSARFYSVAEHMSHGYDVAPRPLKKWVLLHDASEAYVGDMISPIKREMPIYRDIEDRVQAAIAERFGLPFPMPDGVREVDLRLLATEAMQLHKEPAGGFYAHPDWFGPNNFPEPYEFKVECWHPSRAQWEYTRRFMQEFGPRVPAKPMPVTEPGLFEEEEEPRGVAA